MISSKTELWHLFLGGCTPDSEVVTSQAMDWSEIAVARRSSFHANYIFVHTSFNVSCSSCLSGMESDCIITNVRRNRLSGKLPSLLRRPLFLKDRSNLNPGGQKAVN